MEVTTIVIIAIVGTILCVVIKQYKPEYTVLTALGTGVLLLVLLIPQFVQAIEYAVKISNLGKIDTTYTAIMIKALGVCIITQLASDTCKDCGQTSIASKVELGGKISILIISLPMFASLIETVEKLIDL